MPATDYKRLPPLAAVPRDFMRRLPPTEPTLADVLAAVHSLADRFDRLESAATPRRSPLLLDQDEIAKTMALLRVARPITQETPP